MASWRELAEAAADRAPASAPKLKVGHDLPVELQNGLRRLPSRRSPRIEHPRAWPTIVKDALYLAREGWATKALALGWTGHDLFGVGTAGSHEFESLAVWLDGRSVAALGGMKAMTTSGAIFLRHAWGHATSPTVEPVYLWDWRTVEP